VIQHSTFRIFAPYLIVLVAGVVEAAWLSWNGVPCLTSDHAVYHSPAVELATHGRLAIPGFGHLFPRTDVVFACYPPLYQLLLAGWYSIVGFSLRTALTFSFIVHILGALAVMRVTELTIVKENYTPLGRSVALVAIGVIQLVYLVHFDRQEEAALLWLWAEMICCQKPGLARSILSGLFISLAALISPWVGLLGAAVVTFRTFFLTLRTATQISDWIQAGCRLALTGVVAALPIAGWAWLMESLYPGILNDQFFGTMRWIATHREPLSLENNPRVFFSSLFYCRPQAPVFLATLALFPWVYRASVEKSQQPNALALYVTSWLALAGLACIRPEATTYISIVEMLLVPCFISALARYLGRAAADQRWGFVFLGLFVAFASYQAVQLATLPWRWNEAERCDAVCDRLHALIPPGELVNITGRHWYCFQGRNRWHETYFMQDEPELLQARWMVLAVGIGLPPCIDAYELVEQVPTTITARDQTYAYSLWRRKDSPR
jgi:hypothetical protein